MSIDRGSFVYSKAGRDQGDLFIVVDQDRTYVYLADGKIRRLDHPKKKKRKHVSGTQKMDAELNYRLSNDLQVTNADLRRRIKEFIHPKKEVKNG